MTNVSTTSHQTLGEQSGQQALTIPSASVNLLKRWAGRI